MASLCTIILMVDGCGSEDAWTGSLAFVILLYLLLEGK
jgi:hypothetical protein